MILYLKYGIVLAMHSKWERREAKKRGKKRFTSDNRRSIRRGMQRIIEKAKKLKGMAVIIGVFGLISLLIVGYKIRAKKARYHKITAADIAWG